MPNRKTTKPEKGSRKKQPPELDGMRELTGGELIEISGGTGKQDTIKSSKGKGSLFTRRTKDSTFTSG